MCKLGTICLPLCIYIILSFMDRNNLDIRLKRFEITFTILVVIELLTVLSTDGKWLKGYCLFLNLRHKTKQI